MPARPPLADLARSSASPDAVRIALDRLRIASADSLDRIEADARLAHALVSVVAASRSLTRLVLTDGSAIDVIERAVSDTTGMPLGASEIHLGPSGKHLGPSGTVREEGVAPTLFASDPGLACDAEDLALRKQRALLYVAARDLAGLDGLEAVGKMLSEIADRVLGSCLALAAAGEPAGTGEASGSQIGDGSGIAVVAMGKLGAEELNYASDIDLVVVSSEPHEQAAATTRSLVASAGRAYRVDTNLRPEGRSGPIVRSLSSYEAYWERWARPWEFQALLKARFAAGDRELGEKFCTSAAEYLWARRLGVDDLAELRRAKARVEATVSRSGLQGRELKLGHGGIRDVEFSVQLLQLVHGAGDPSLRVRATLPALSELAVAGYVDPGDASSLALAYRLLRTVEHRLQLRDDAQVHTVPAASSAREHLARVLGIGGSPVAGPAARLDEILARHQGAARAVHQRLFFRPLLEAFAVPEGAPATTAPVASLTPAAADERLAAFGFRQADRTRQALQELTHGLTRSSRLMQQTLPLMLDWLSASPDPDQGLLGLRTLLGASHRRDLLVTAFRDSPELARRLCIVVGTSRRLATTIARQPDLASRLDDPSWLARPSAGSLRERALATLERAPPFQSASLRSFVDSETLRIAVRDLFGLADLTETGAALSDLAAGTLGAALDLVDPKVPLAVVAMGSFGGGELAYGSDLDVLFVHGDSGPAAATEAERSAGALIRLLNGPTPAEGIICIDASLRPEGRHGPLARSLLAFERYHQRWGAVWERQALLRARPAAGDEQVAERFLGLAAEAVWSAPLSAEDEREIRRVKARIERERIAPGEDARYHFKLGHGALADIEWTVQLLQLRHGVAGPSTVSALRDLVDRGAIEPADADALSASFASCTTTRTRWHLVGEYFQGVSGAARARDALPGRPELRSRLARSLGTTPVALQEEYRKVTRRARRVVERLFYETT